MTAQPAEIAQPRPRAGAGPWLALSLLGALVTALCAWLWPEWQRNADLSHGMLMPAVFAILLWQARQQGPHRYLRGGRGSAAVLGGLLAGGILAVAAAGLYASALGWSHSLVSLALCAALALLLAAGWVVLAGPGIRWIGINWTAGVAIGLWLLCSPLPPGTYQRISLGLQLGITESVLATLHLLGIPALRHGNILQLAHVTVGVEEACSGIRSLVSCLFAGLMLSALLTRRPAARAVLVAASAPVALVLNFVRSLTLTLLANAGIDISGLWHDMTGFAVVGVSTALLAGLAVTLDRRYSPPSLPTQEQDKPSHSRRTAVLVAGLLLATGLAGTLAIATRPPARPSSPAPDLAQLLPTELPGWEVATASLFQFSGTLQTEHLVQRQYRQRGGDGDTEVTIYLAYWSPGQAPVSLVATHTPDACWPGAGWNRLNITPERAVLAAGGRMLFPAEYRVFEAGGRQREVWFWHLHDGRPLVHRDPYSPIALLRIAAEHGFRRPGEQVFIRISSNRPWAEIAGSAPVTGFLSRTRELGL